MIEVSGLSKRYGDIDALRDVSFTVQKGNIVGFLGANGAGKTTTMDVISGCIGADKGIAKISGFDITESPIEAKRRLGYLPDVPPLHIEMEVADFIEYSAKLHGVPKGQIGSRVAYTLEKLSLGDVRKRLVGNLSKGYRQRVGLAQALVHDPEVLVLDEPTEGLDPHQIAQIRDLIKSLAGQHTILLSSHILSEVQNTCDRLVIIHKGAVVQQGTYEELSTAIQSGFSYRIRVAKNEGQLIELLREISGISGVSMGVTKFEAEFVVDSQIGEGVLDSVAKAIVDRGLGLREMAKKSKSLEEVFMKITN